MTHSGWRIIKEEGGMALVLRRHLGMLLLGVYLLIVGIVGLTPVPMIGPVLPILALLAGVFIILGR